MSLFLLKLFSGLVFILLPGFSIKENIDKHPYLTILSLVFGSFLLFLSFSPLLQEKEDIVPVSIKDTDLERIVSKIRNSEKALSEKVQIKVVYSGIWIAFKGLDTNNVDAYLDGVQIVDGASYNKGFNKLVDTSIGTHKLKIDIDYLKSMIPPETYEFNILTSGLYELSISYNMLALTEKGNWKFNLTKIKQTSSK